MTLLYYFNVTGVTQVEYFSPLRQLGSCRRVALNHEIIVLLHKKLKRERIGVITEDDVSDGFSLRRRRRRSSRNDND